MPRNRLSILVALVAIGLTGCGEKAPARVPDKLGFWVWTSPFALDETTSSQLDRIGANELFVRAGTFSYDGTSLQPTLVQQFLPPQGKPVPSIHLVFNFDLGAIKHFEEVDLRTYVTAITDLYAKQKNRAEGYAVRGLQIDFDCPTRLLRRYGEMMKEVRKRLPKHTELSCTGLVSWIRAGNVGGLLEQVDFWAPQFYEGRIPKRIDDETQLSDLDEVVPSLDRLESLGRPYRIGIPAYGHCLLYDEKGAFKGMYRGLSLREAYRHDRLQLVSQTERNGETRAVFRAVQAGENGKGLGYRLVFRLSGMSQIQKTISEVKSKALSNCQGFLFYRLASPDDSMAVPLGEFLAEKRPDAEDINLQLKLDTKEVPFGRIEGTGDAMRSQTLVLKAKGSFTSRLAKEAVRVEVEINNGLIQEINPGDMDGVIRTDGVEKGLRMKSVKAWRAWIRPGETVRFGPLLTTGGTLSARVTLLSKRSSEPKVYILP